MLASGVSLAVGMRNLPRIRSIAIKKKLSIRRFSETPPPTQPRRVFVQKTTAGTGNPTGFDTDLYKRLSGRGPISWPSLVLTAVVGVGAVVYYNMERERRLESALGKIVTSESDGMWSPDPERLAPRRFIKTKYGYFPVDEGFGASELPHMAPVQLETNEGNLD
jgi:hypothetical protein